MKSPVAWMAILYSTVALYLTVQNRAATVRHETRLQQLTRDQQLHAQTWAAHERDFLDSASVSKEETP